MERYHGQDLGERPHIAVLGSSKIGNFVVTVPLLQALVERFNSPVIDFWGSELTRDFETELPQISWRFSWDRSDGDQLSSLSEAASQRFSEFGPLDLLINCDGFNPVTQVLASWLRPHFVAGASLSLNSRSSFPWGDHPYQRFLNDPDWDSPAFLARYPDFFKSNYIGELLCRLAFLDMPDRPCSLPSRPPSFTTPDVLIHVTTTRAAKIWPAAHWQEVLSWCSRQAITVGLVGSPPKRQQEDYNAGDLEDILLSTTDLIDLRGQTSLIELAGACLQAKAVVSVDAGPMHIAAAVGTPTLAVVGNDPSGLGASPIRLWMPRSSNCERTVSTFSCDGCEAVRFRNDSCLKESHFCMEGVPASQVITWLDRLLRTAEVSR